MLVGTGTLHWPDYRFTLTDTVTGARHRFPWPSILKASRPRRSIRRAATSRSRSPTPRINLTGNQVLDVWVLDTATAKLTHLPSTPAYVSLKRTSIAWTHDGRLVLLGEEDGRAFVGVWRPGREALSLKSVRLPEREGGSDEFAPLG